MNKLETLITKCKCGVHLTINGHRDYYETVEQYFKSHPSNEEDIDSDVYEKMKELDTIINIHFYPTTPVGFYTVFHYDLDMALDEALSCI